MGRIVVAVHQSDSSRLALRWAGVLRAAARNADLVVIGTKALLGMHIARSWCLRRFPCPVVTIGAQGLH